MIAAAVKMKSGQKDWMIVAGNTDCQYDCCAGIVARMIGAMSAASAPIARIHCAARRGTSHAAMKAAQEAQIATGVRP